MDRLPGGCSNLTRPARRLAAILIALALAVVVARAEAPSALRGVALVIGNGDYEHIARLPNPPNDARAIEEMLDRLGFDTTISADRDARRLKRDLDGFVEDAEGADVAVIYYSGHGIEAGGENYLVPVDADPAALEAADERLVPLSRVLHELTRTVPVTIVLLDACRSDPFPQGVLLRRTPGAQGQPIGGAGLGAERGAVALRQGAADDGNLGTVIGFAAEPGRVALDGEAGGNSPYAAAVLRHLAAMDGTEFGTVMRMVTEEVYLKTGGRQRPWVNESLRRLLFFGSSVAGPEGEEGEILAERRSLLLKIAELPSVERQQIEAIAQSGGVPMDGLYAMLAALGVDAPDEPGELDQLMRAQADRLKAMMAERQALAGADAEIARLSGLADRAIGEGALETAIRLLGRAKARVETLDRAVDAAEADIRRKRIEFAAVFARSAEAHALAFDSMQAAQDYARAFEQVERWDDRLAWTYRKSEAEALYQHGLFKGDNAALQSAIDVSRSALAIAGRLPGRSEKAIAHNTLGNALQALGDRQGGAELLDQSIAAYRAALDALEQGAEPLFRAKIGNNLANTMTYLGTRRNDRVLLSESVTLFEDALRQFHADGDRVSWIKAQNNIGKTLLALAELETSTDSIFRAGNAFLAGLAEVDRSTDPLTWATMQNNLGNAYEAMARRTPERYAMAGWFLQSMVAYKSGLQEMDRERAPQQRAILQANLANVLQALGSLQPNQAQALQYLREARETLEGALSEVTRALSPLQWATIRYSLSRTLVATAARLGPGDEARKLLEEAIAASSDALGEFTRDRVPLRWAEVQVQIGQIHQNMALLANDPARARGHLIAAEAAQRAALSELAPERAPMQRASLQHDLGMTLMELAPGETGIARYEQAEAIFREERALRSRQHDPVGWARAQAGLANAMSSIGRHRKDRQLLVESRRLTQEAWDVVRPIDRQYDGIIEARLKEIDAALAGLQ